MDLRPLTNEALLASLKSLVIEERERLGVVIEHLMEVDRRDVVLDYGFPSLFAYCVQELKYSEAATYYRIRAARAARKHPELLEGLISGSLHLEAVVRLYPHLTEENKAAVLEQASGASRKEVLRLAADLGAPAPQQRDVVRPLPPAPSAHPEVIPPPRVEFRFEADEDLATLIDRIRDRLRTKYPDGRLKDLVREGMLAVERELDRPARPGRPSKPGSRHVPKAVKKQVYARDQGRCAFVSPDGRRCSSTSGLEYDHVVPWARGGRSDDPTNIRLLCRPHNRRQAEKIFGPTPSRRSS